MNPQAADLSVPLLDLSAQYRPIRDEILTAMIRVADSQRFIMGPEVEALERELGALIGVEHAIGVSSGTDALLAIMMALGVGVGDEVLTPTYSFFATAGCISRLGATPVFVDIDPVTFNIDVAAAARAVTPRTRAILVVHLFGLCADMTPLVELATASRVPLIEDAAQAIGATDHHRAAGTIGRAAAFSFFPSKNLGGFGDGGLVTTNDPEVASEIRLLRDHGMQPKYFHKRVGGNFRLDALQAAVLRVKAPHLAGWTTARRRNADRYRELFAAAGLSDIVDLPVEPVGFGHIYNQFVIRGERRDALREHLTAQRIGTEIYYPIPFHRQECFQSLQASEGASLRAGEFASGQAKPSYPHADRAAATSLALPIYGELTLEQQRYVVDAIASFYAP